MAEYIEREKVYDIFSAKQQVLLKYHRYYQLNDADKEEFDLYDSYMNEVESIPSADVVEVKHGHWVRNAPNPEAMRTLHKAGIAKAMSENSI